MAKQHKIKQIYKEVESKAKDAATGTINFAKDAFESIPEEHKNKIKGTAESLSHSFETHIKYDLSKANKASLNFWKAKFFGGLLGVILFGFPGLIIGVIVGHFLDLSQKSNDFKNFVNKVEKEHPEKDTPASSFSTEQSEGRESTKPSSSKKTAKTSTVKKN